MEVKITPVIQCCVQNVAKHLFSKIVNEPSAIEIVLVTALSITFSGSGQ